MPSIETTVSGSEYWRSIDELAETPEFQHFMKEEFPGHNAEFDDSVTRRSFLKIMGASMALAGLTACRWPEEKIAPYAFREEHVTPGKPRYFATTMDHMGGAIGLLVTSYDNRPVKIEGNPTHPHNLGSASIAAQGTILEMYDPDRSRTPVNAGKPSTWAAFDAFAGGHFGALRGNGGEGLFVVSEQSSSPTFARLKGIFAESFPKATWLEYEAATRDNEREGTRQAFGRPMRVVHEFAKARRIVSFDSDFLMTHPASLKYAREYAAMRSPDSSEMSRFYCIESTYSATGSNADHRYGLAPSKVMGALAELLSALEGGTPTTNTFIKAIAEDLAANRGASIVIVGDHLPAEAHALACRVNELLGNNGSSVMYAEAADADRPTHHAAIQQAAGALTSGAATTMLILGGNPAYDAPGGSGFADALKGAKGCVSIHLSLYDDETSEACTWHLNRAHYLESWGDAVSWEGTRGIQQPMIAPLFDGRTPIELLAQLAGHATTKGYELVRETFGDTTGADFEAGWRKALHDGHHGEPALAMAAGASVSAESAAKAAAAITNMEHRGAEVVFAPDYRVHDGRFANLSWLQELPDPMTKMTWENVALIDPATAEEQKITTGQRVSISANGKEHKLYGYVMPGQAAGTVVLKMGYGRRRGGQVINEMFTSDVEKGNAQPDVHPLRGGDNPLLAMGAAVRRTDGSRKLAMTQDHHTIDKVGYDEREKRAATLIRENTIGKYKSDPGNFTHIPGAVHIPPGVQLWEPLNYEDDYQWGMTIDLNTCIGCNACVVACQAENNIPVVGRDEVLVGREMHWIRIDRYYKGDIGSPQAVHQPVACMHCETAPCEAVCPVAATLHDEQGLNVMVYNRCIGTRYCSNNCPYKVRRFNYFNYNKDIDKLRAMQYNPEVTIRARGVMEKCTYCTQRIQAAKIEAKNEGRAIADGEIKTACQQTCPTHAIQFGNIKDPNSGVSKMMNNPRQYEMLEELNVKTRTRYLAKVRNPNPALETPAKMATNDHH